VEEEHGKGKEGKVEEGEGKEGEGNREEGIREDGSEGKWRSMECVFNSCLLYRAHITVLLFCRHR
jgi:hypothetical protein